MYTVCNLLPQIGIIFIGDSVDYDTLIHNKNNWISQVLFHQDHGWNTCNNI